MSSRCRRPGRRRWSRCRTAAHRGATATRRTSRRVSCSTTSLRRYGLAVGAARGLGVGEVLGRDVHPQALGGEAGRGDVESAEEAHYALTPMAALRMSDARVRHLDGGLLLERVGGELGRLRVDVDRGAVGARGAGRSVLGRGEGEVLRPPCASRRCCPWPPGGRRGSRRRPAGSQECSRSRCSPPAPHGACRRPRWRARGQAAWCRRALGRNLLRKKLEVRPWTYEPRP